VGTFSIVRSLDYVVVLVHSARIRNKRREADNKTVNSLPVGLKKVLWGIPFEPGGKQPSRSGLSFKSQGPRKKQCGYQRLRRR